MVVTKSSVLSWSTSITVSDTHFLSCFTYAKTSTKRKKWITWWPWALHPDYWSLRTDNVNPCDTTLLPHYQPIRELCMSWSHTLDDPPFSSVQFSCSVVSNSLWPQGLQNARPPCTSPTPGVYSLVSLESVMPSNHLCCPLLLLPSICPSIRVFSNESVLHIGWPKYWSFRFSISPSNDIQDWFQDWYSGWTGWIPLRSKGLSKVFSNTTVQKHQFLSAQLCL